MSSDEKDYSDYRKHLSNLISVMSLFSGFMFTAYTILITRLPDPSNIIAQFALYIISAFLGIFLFLLGYFVMTASCSCRAFPPLTKRTAIVNSLFFASTTVAMGIVTTLMSFLWNLTSLAFIQVVTWILLCVAVYLFVIKPAQQYRKYASSE
ncbi:MAG: hypothetical protein QXE76_02295 [Candidatus Bathyarchaeia archaeon]